MAVEAKPEEPYRELLIKMIPIDVITATVAGISAVSVVEEATLKKVLLWIIFAAAVAATPLYMKFKHQVSSKTQLVLATIACIIWIMTISPSAFTVTFEKYSVVIGGTIMILYTGLIAPFVVKLTSK